jgi:DNA-binding NarL/FixJ family response regulator
VNNLRVLLIAPDPLARAALAGMLGGECEIVGRIDGASDWNDAIDLHGPDVILCDVGWQISLDVPDVRELGVPVVALVGDEESAETIWQCGVQGLIDRAASQAQISQTLQTVTRRLIVYDPNLLNNPITPTARFELSEPLTEREMDVLTLLAEGLTNRAIGIELDISDHTVKFHVNSLLTKLNAQSRTEAAVRATRLGLLTL